MVQYDMLGSQPYSIVVGELKPLPGNLANQGIAAARAEIAKGPMQGSRVYPMVSSAVQFNGIWLPHGVFWIRKGLHFHSQPCFPANGGNFAGLRSVTQE